MRLTNSAARYAKLSAPRLHDALPRHHLFSMLDRTRHTHAATWIAGPPGAGKTTLAATYLAQAKQPSIWYQIDSTDADPAAFFYFLAQSLGEAGTTLPWLAAELSGDVPRFARTFFRDFYTRLPENSVLVFDNLQDFDWEANGELVEIALSEVPPAVHVLALSRDAPPSRLARLEVDGRLATLAREALRLDADEARVFGQFGRPVATDDQMEWLEQADGWAAGIVMLRSHLTKISNKASIPKLEGRDAIFRYFAGVILERMPQASQTQLLMLSCLPSISEADATLLTGDESAGRLLKRFYRNGLFVDRLGTKTPIYHFHSLFQEFLAQEARQRLEPDVRSTLLERAAIIIDGQGRTEEAARLYRDAKAFDSLASLLIRTAKQMRATGRGLTWCEWLSCLPAETLRDHPQQKSQGFFVRFPQLASRLAALALDAGIEVEHIRGIVRRQQLKAPGQFIANWPRPIAVRLFGEMQMLFDGEIAATKGKTQQRLLKLLRLLLIAGKSGKTQSSLIASLWPEAEDGRSALSVAIHRLRKLLKFDEAILVSGGRISINMKLIASDLFAFDDFCERVDNLPTDSPVSSVVQFSNELLSIYRGLLCEGEEDTWLLPARERTHQRFLAMATNLGMCLEAKQQWTQARDLYLRALSTEPLSEVVYRSLMRCAHAQNDPSAAFSAYRRCRDTLSILLGRKPSEETERLAMSLGLLGSR